MRVVGDGEYPVSGERDAAIGAATCLAEQARRARRAERPDLAARDGVERIDLVGAGDVHDAVHDHWGDLQPGRAGNRKDPGRGQALHIGRINLRQRTIPVTRVAAIVAGPVEFWLDRAFRVSIAATHQQMEFAIGGQQGGAERGRTGQGAVERAAILNFQCRGLWLEGSAAAAAACRSRRGVDGARGQTAQVRDQHLHLGVVEIEVGHALVEAAGVHQSGDLRVGMRSNEGEDALRPVRAIGIAAMTDGAVRSERPGRAGLRLREQRRRQEEDTEECVAHED